MPTAVPASTTIPLATLESAADALGRDPRLAEALATAAHALHARPDYAAWHGGGLTEGTPFEADAALPGALADLGLATGARFLAKVNLLGGKVFLTDGVWVDKADRVFPFADESETLIRHAAARVPGFEPDLVVDLATGCGHSAIGYPGEVRRFALDINPRALAYARINGAMNGLSRDSLRVLANDVRDGVPVEVMKAGAANVLFLANMPFGPSAGRGVLPLTSDGGESGVDLQLATVDAIDGFARAMGPSCRVRASIMGMTVGAPDLGRWEMMDPAIERFGADRVRWTHLPDELVYRVDGLRAGGNPSPLAEALSHMADCRLYFTDESRPSVKARWRDLADSLGRRGWTHMAYGIVDVDLG